jgi:molybdenum cofactor guanylyltransferase
MYSLILNAGGQSRRMGQNKALLRVPPGGRPLLDHMLHRLHRLAFDPILVVTNQPDLAAALMWPRAIELVPDDQPGRGPLGGIATGLARCQGWAVVLACDLPLVSPQVVQALTHLAQQRAADGDWAWQAVVPQVEGYAQPFYALYHASLAPVIQERLAQGVRRVSSLLETVRTRWVTEAELRPLDPHLHSFLNVNTPDEWAQACRLLEKEGANR